MIKAIIFDLDGTLLDTSLDIHQVLNAALKKFSLPEIPLEKTKEYLGDGAKKLVERAVGNRRGLFGSVYAEYIKNFVSCDNKSTVLYDGEEAALKILKSKGIKLAIISNKPQSAVERVYVDFLEKFAFCEVLGQTEYYPLKPDPTSTNAVIDRLGVKKDECLFVGDGDADVVTARRAGVRCVSALWGFRSRAELEAAGAEEFAENFPDLLKNVIK